MQYDSQEGGDLTFLAGLGPQAREWLEAVASGIPVEEATVALRIYMAGDAPNSALALTNLRAIIGEYPDERFHLEVVDILKDPMRAFRDAIIVTPTLVRITPLPTKKIVGNLNNRARVAAALGLGGEE